MTKEDYMKLPKERLAELLAERDTDIIRFVPIRIESWHPSCYEGGPCTNPFHDCINCPHLSGGHGTWTSNTNVTEIL